MSELDVGRQTNLRIQLNFFHLFSHQMVSAMVTLDNAHRYSMETTTAYHIDADKARARVCLVYTYKGKQYTTERTTTLTELRALPGDEAQKSYASDIIKQMAAETQKEAQRAEAP